MSIEAYHDKICVKFSCLERLLEIAISNTERAQIQLQKLFMRYNEGTSDIISKYYDALLQNNLSAAHGLYNKYYKYMLSERVEERFANIYGEYSRAESDCADDSGAVRMREICGLNAETAALRKKYEAQIIVFEIPKSIFPTQKR